MVDFVIHKQRLQLRQLQQRPHNDHSNNGNNIDNNHNDYKRQPHKHRDKNGPKRRVWRRLGPR
jgi:hypothetical protein